MSQPLLPQPRVTGVNLLDNVARIDDAGVDIYDRRAYPFEQDWVHCDSVGDIARAIVGMVTQSHGPTVAAGYGMALAAREATFAPNPLAVIERGAAELIATRPTNDSLRRIVIGILEECRLSSAISRERIAIEHVRRHVVKRQEIADRIGIHGARLFGGHTRLLTHCWAETGLSQIVLTAVSDGKTVEAFCPETRPYLQGSRLTADALRDAGAAVTVIPDTAVAYVISEGLVDLAISGSDRLTADGGVVNKIGTLGIATLAQRYGVPYYAIGTDVDRSAASVADVQIELRDGREALQCLGIPTAARGVVGFYPAFDRTPPQLVTGYITPDGVLLGSELRDWKGSGQ